MAEEPTRERLAANLYESFLRNPDKRKLIIDGLVSFLKHRDAAARQTWEAERARLEKRLEIAERNVAAMAVVAGQWIAEHGKLADERAALLRRIEKAHREGYMECVKDYNIEPPLVGWPS